MLPVLNELYGETEASKIYSSKNDVPELVESSQPPPTPPPPYQKVSPTVLQWESKCMKDKTSCSNRSYRTIPPAMVDPDDHEELDKLYKSMNNASNRSNRSSTHYQPHTYDPKVVKLHKRPPKNENLFNKYRNMMDLDHGGDGGDGGGSMHSTSSNSSYFRSHRMKPARWRTKCDKIKWDGLPSSLRYLGERWRVI